MKAAQVGKRLLKLSILLAVLAHASLAWAQLVLMVSKESPIDSLSAKEIRKIFKGQSLVHAGNRPLQVVEYSPERDRFYKILYDQSSYSIAKHWLRLIFSGERVVPPKSFSDARRLCKYVSQELNAVSFLPRSLFEQFRYDYAIKAVVVDGRNYQDREYLFYVKSTE